jgi:hypothetical protein
MSSRDDPALLLLPAGFRVLLILCACCLALHFTAEGLALGGGQITFDPLSQVENTHPAHEHGEDLFAFSALQRLQVDPSLTWPVTLAPIHSRAILIPPLLPPPNS